MVATFILNNKTNFSLIKSAIVDNINKFAFIVKMKYG